MVDALRMVRREEIADGYFHWISTGVQMGADGIGGLYQYVGTLEEWSFFQSAGGHQYSEEWDAVVSRVKPRISSVLGGALTSYLRRRIRIPYDFGSFPSNAIGLIAKANDITGPTLTATLLVNGVPDAGINAVDILPALADTYTLAQLTPSGTYTRGDLATLEIAWASDAADQYVEIADLAVAYVSGRGNV